MNEDFYVTVPCLLPEESLQEGRCLGGKEKSFQAGRLIQLHLNRVGRKGNIEQRAGEGGSPAPRTPLSAPSLVLILAFLPGKEAANEQSSFYLPRPRHHLWWRPWEKGTPVLPHRAPTCATVFCTSQGDWGGGKKNLRAQAKPITPSHTPTQAVGGWGGWGMGQPYQCFPQGGRAVIPPTLHYY